MGNTKQVFVTGITGNQGGAVAQHLLERGYSVVGLTRNADSEKANYWKAHGAKVIEGDMDKPSTFTSHLNKADAVFLVQSLQGKDKEIRQGKRFIDALNPQGDIHVVYASVLGADLDTGVPHFESKYELEKYLKSKNLNYTILRPASFFENHLIPRVYSDIMKGKYISPLERACTQQMIGVYDIGKIATAVFSNTDNYLNKTLSIATDEWKTEDIPPVLSKALNKPVVYKKLPGFITRLAVGKDLSRMFKYMNQNDFCVIDDIQKVREEFNIQGDFRTWASNFFTHKASKQNTPEV